MPLIRGAASAADASRGVDDGGAHALAHGAIDRPACGETASAPLSPRHVAPKEERTHGVASRRDEAGQCASRIGHAGSLSRGCPRCASRGGKDPRRSCQHAEQVARFDGDFPETFRRRAGREDDKSGDWTGGRKPNHTTASRAAAFALSIGRTRGRIARAIGRMPRPRAAVSTVMSATALGRCRETEQSSVETARDRAVG